MLQASEWMAQTIEAATNAAAATLLSLVAVTIAEAFVTVGD